MPSPVLVLASIAIFNFPRLNLALGHGNRAPD